MGREGKKESSDVGIYCVDVWDGLGNVGGVLADACIRDDSGVYSSASKMVLGVGLGRFCQSTGMYRIYWMAWRWIFS